MASQKMSTRKEVGCQEDLPCRSILKLEPAREQGLVRDGPKGIRKEPLATLRDAIGFDTHRQSSGKPATEKANLGHSIS